jgi:hypothetical protein
VTDTQFARDTYRPGGAWGICDRCGLKYRHAELRKEWSGLMVCRADYDPRPADLTPRIWTPEGLPVRDARPDPGDVLGPNLTRAGDL